MNNQALRAMDRRPQGFCDSTLAASHPMRTLFQTMLDNAPLLAHRHGALTIEGYSRAAVQSYWRVPELRLAFDIGAHPWDFMGVPALAISHVHLDHIASLGVDVGPTYTNARERYFPVTAPTARPTSWWSASPAERSGAGHWWGAATRHRRSPPRPARRQWQGRHRRWSSLPFGIARRSFLPGAFCPFGRQSRIR